MTLKEYRIFLRDKKSVSCYGMEFKLLDLDVVRIKTKDESYELDYRQFVDVDYNYNLSEDFWNLELTDIFVSRDTVTYRIVLFLDTVPKEHADDTDNISARMKYI